jgi:phospholipid transport system substrate-binding protein
MTTKPIGRHERASTRGVALAVLAWAVLACAALACAALVAASALADEPAVATDTPAATVESLHRGLVALSRDRPKAELAERYRALEPLIEKTHDLPYIAEFALRRQWPMLSEADRARFIAAFERLSVMTYASRFKNVTPETFKTTQGDSAAGGAAAAPRGGASGGSDAASANSGGTNSGAVNAGGATASSADASRAQIHTAIARPGDKDVTLDYLLQRKDGAWRIINIVADGVSDLALKRAEYQRVLAGGSIDDLIEYVDEQTARLEQK